MVNYKRTAKTPWSETTVPIDKGHTTKTLMRIDNFIADKYGYQGGGKQWWVENGLWDNYKYTLSHRVQDELGYNKKNHVPPAVMRGLEDENYHFEVQALIELGYADKKW